MKLKIALILMVILLMSTFASCSDSSDDNNPAVTTSPQSSTESTTEAEINETDSPQTEKSQVIASISPVINLDNGISLTVGGSADEFFKTAESIIGSYIDMSEAPSCIRDGYDRVYTYDGFNITTVPGSSEDIISEITLTSDSVAIGDGVMIGSDRSDIDKYFGEDYTESFGVRKYIGEDITVTVVFDGGIVSALSVAIIQ